VCYRIPSMDNDYINGLQVPIDPMDLLQCEGCQ
jgi:hypothetical protein